MAFEVGTAIAAIQQDQYVSGSASINKFIDELSGDCGGTEPVQLRVRCGESKATVQILDSMAGQIQDHSVLGMAVVEESLDLLGDEVRPLVLERPNLVSAYSGVGQQGRKRIGIPGWGAQLR
jgi:hypothetical protein